MNAAPDPDRITATVPYLRRYARALCGDQKAGDQYVRLMLETLLQDQPEIDSDHAKRDLFRLFQKVWDSAQPVTAAADNAQSREEKSAQQHLQSLVSPSRKALLLSIMEGFDVADIAYILGVDADAVSQLLLEAHRELDAVEQTAVLIIEDEPIIALDLEAIVAGLGHRVIGNAQTRDEAVTQAKSDPPGLILADIALADGSSGIDAVADILADIDAPVIFITAYPEKLLTGDKPEPAFLISKPFVTENVKLAIGQALFFNRPKLGAAGDGPAAMAAPR